jgi:hypothetical protein
MNLENTPWLFAPALFYVFVIVALLPVEIVKKTLIHQKWKIRTALLGLMPLFLALIIAVLSMAGEMLYLFPEYASWQQEVMQFVVSAYGYNNNLLIMFPMGLIYFVVLSISQNKKFLFLGNQSSHNKYQMNAKADGIQTLDSKFVYLRQRKKELELEREELKRKDDEWREACAVDDNYWNNWSNP